MNRQFLRTAAGFGSLSALALVMVACGGSSSSAPTTPTNQAPSTPTIVGPTTAITLHPAFYNLSSVDPEGDPITFIVNGTPITGNSYRLDPTAAGTTTLSVQARDNKSPAATSGTATLTVNVAANRPPQFLSQPTGQLTGANSQTINWTNFQVSAQDPDTDDVAYSVVAGTTSFTDVTGGAVSINATTGAVSFTGTVATGKTVGTATFTVKAEDKLPGTSTLLGASATQIVTLTYFTGNQAPVILTTSLPNWPLNHFIPITKGAGGFPVEASDPNGDSLTWTLDAASTAAGLALTSSTGNTTQIISNTKRTSSASQNVTLTVNDGKGLTASKTLTISVVADSKPTINSTPYTETVSGVKFFDKSQVKDQITGRARFYNGADFATPSSTAVPPVNFKYDGRINWISNYAGSLYVAGESNHAVDAKATDFNWSSPFLPAGTDQAVAGWTARTIFRDSEGDAINYTVDARSVYVSSPLQPVGQTYTLVNTGASSNTFPNLAGYTPAASSTAAPAQGVGEFPMIDAADGTMTWLPVLHEQMNAYTGWDNFGSAISKNILANPSIWSFTVMGYEKVWNPGTGLFEIVADPSQAGRIDYSIKVQPNNRPKIGPALGIPGATANVPGAAINQVVNPTTSVLIGGGPSAASNYYGRPSIQEPESRRYDVSAGTNLQYITGGFDYSKANDVKPAVWRWLFARAGGDPVAAGKVFGTGFSPSDAQIYDPDTTTQSGHQDAVVADMGTPTYPAADTTGNYPAISTSSVTFYNPWLTSTNAGDFQVSWGPNRTQYLIARVTASAAYAFPVETRDQYERIENRNLGINPIFGTVRFTNSRVRTFADAGTEVSAARRGGSFTAGNYPGDPVVAAPLASQFTFAYLPFPSNGASSDETNFGSFLFAGTGPASGNQASSGLYTAASWITLNSTEAPQYGFHTGNPLNDETGTFNLPSYASVLEGSSSASTREDVRQYNYTWINGANPTNPVAADNYAVGTWANHEVRAQVIPSNSPYLFSFYGTSMPANYYNTYPTELAGSTMMLPLRNFFNGIVPASVGPTGHWYNLSATAHGWVYNLYQGEVDMQNAVAGRGVTLPTAYGATRLRWTYSWPTQVTNSNLDSDTGQVNNWKLGDVMQIAIPNHGSNGRYFFVGDGGPNDTLAPEVRGWGGWGITVTAGGVLADTVTVFGNATSSAGFTGLDIADNTPFHVPSNSLWVYNNFNGAGTSGFLNTPNRTSFSPGSSATQLPFSVGLRGYINNSVANGFAAVDPGYMASYAQVGAIPALINTGAGDRVYFLWLRQDEDHATAWGNWDSSLLVGGGSTYTATGGLTTVPDFSMTNNAVNSTLPASYASEAQISMAAGNLPGQNHGANVFVSSDPALYNGSIISATGFARSQWGFMNPTMGFQPSGSNNVRLVNPAFSTLNAARWNNQVAAFRHINSANVSFEGGVRDSAIVYGVRRHTDEKGNANAELGLAGIEPGSPLLAQWYNIQLDGDIALDSATIANTTTVGLTDVGSDWPAVFNFYSPFTNDPAWANVMEYKMNYLVGMTYPGTQAGGTLWKVPAQASNVFELGKPLTDATCTNPNNTVNPGNPIIRPIEFLRISDYTSNTVASSPSIRTTLDLVNSDPVDMAGNGSFVLGGGSSTFIQARGNVRVTFQASVNNQVLPSGYVIEIFQLPGAGLVTNQPVLLGSVRAGHLGGKDAIQRVYLPSMHSFSGLTSAAYFFRIRTVWHQGVNFEKQPTKQAIPMGYADYVSAPFVTQ